MNAIASEVVHHAVSTSVPGTNRALAGKTAIITGSTSGIGLGIARALAGAGANIVINGFGQPEEIAETRDELSRAFSVDVRFHGADISKPEQVLDLVRSTETAFGAVDILVNNAGIQHVAPIEEFPKEKWDSVLAINLSGAFHAIRTVVPGMKTRGYGRIVNVASAHGLVASPFKAAYVAAKHGIVGLTKVVALELAENGVTCNAICPGYVWTPLVEKQIDDQARAHKISREKVVREVLLIKQPNKRFSTVDELGALTLFLCSDAAATITGPALPMDGGWTAQ